MHRTLHIWGVPDMLLQWFLKNKQPKDNLCLDHPLLNWIRTHILGGINRNVCIRYKDSWRNKSPSDAIDLDLKELISWKIHYYSKVLIAMYKRLKVYSITQLKLL